MDHPTSPLKMPVTIAPPPGAMVCYGVAADAHDLHTPMKKSRSDEKLSDVDLQEARHQFHQMLSRERPELSNRDKGRIVRSTINKKTADNLDAAIQQKMANLEGERQVRPDVVRAVLNTGCSTSDARISHAAQDSYVQLYLMGDVEGAFKKMCDVIEIEESVLRQKLLRLSDLVWIVGMLESQGTSLAARLTEFSDIISEGRDLCVRIYRAVWTLWRAISHESSGVEWYGTVDANVR